MLILLVYFLQFILHFPMAFFPNAKHFAQNVLKFLHRLLYQVFLYVEVSYMYIRVLLYHAFHRSLFICIATLLLSFFQWMQQRWDTNIECYVNRHNLKPRSVCSIIIYLSEVCSLYNFIVLMYSRTPFQQMSL